MLWSILVVIKGSLLYSHLYCFITFYIVKIILAWILHCILLEYTNQENFEEDIFEEVSQFKVRNNFFLNCFFPSLMVEWNKLYSDFWIRIVWLSFIFNFTKCIFNSIRPRSNEVFNATHSKSFIFKHNFLGTLKLICICGFDLLEIF